MKKIIAVIFCLVFSSYCFAQLNTEANKFLLSKEDSLKAFADKILNEPDAGRLLIADSNFKKILVRALKTPYSFYYPFDSLLSISRLYAPDSSFRIITWQLILGDNLVVHQGAIQMNTKNGALKLFPLIDQSDLIKNQSDTIANNRTWIGAMYYNIVQKEFNEKKFYTLLGFDAFTIRANRKIIDILSFDENNEPVFGGDYFDFGKTYIKKTPIARYIIEYKKDAAPKLNFDPELNKIIVEHLISESGEPEKKWTLIPDGDYEAFEWLNGKWVYIEKIFHKITPEGHPPVPNPVKDNNGNLLENKLKVP